VLTNAQKLAYDVRLVGRRLTNFKLSYVNRMANGVAYSFAKEAFALRIDDLQV